LRAGVASGLDSFPPPPLDGAGAATAPRSHSTIDSSSSPSSPSPSSSSYDLKLNLLVFSESINLAEIESTLQYDRNSIFRGK